MSQEEVARSLEIEDMFMVLPAARNIYRNIKYLYSGENKPVERPYISSEEPLLSKDQIKELLLNNNLLSEDISGR